MKEFGNLVSLEEEHLCYLVRIPTNRRERRESEREKRRIFEVLSVIILEYQTLLFFSEYDAVSLYQSFLSQYLFNIKRMNYFANFKYYSPDKYYFLTHFKY